MTEQDERIANLFEDIAPRLAAAASAGVPHEMVYKLEDRDRWPLEIDYLPLLPELDQRDIAFAAAQRSRIIRETEALDERYGAQMMQAAEERRRRRAAKRRRAT